jgi:hypothetical protein
MKAVMLALSLLLVAGCEDHYRYPCQDPANWNTEECQRPQCEAEGICPDQLLGREIDLQQSKVEAVEDSTTEEQAPCEQPVVEESN